MLPEDIDDLFRERLDGHASPPGEDLWVRLQAATPQGQTAETAAKAAPEPLDHLFQKSLLSHVTPPHRELWERLEDEHLRPRKRRAAIWWPMALAATVALLLVAGGAGLWLGFPFKNSRNSTIANHSTPENPSTLRGLTSQRARLAQASGSMASAPGLATAAEERPTSAQPKNSASPVSTQKNAFQATRAMALASTASKARQLGPLQARRHPREAHRQPDVAFPLVAQVKVRPAADEHQPTSEPPVPAGIVPTPKPEVAAAQPAAAPAVSSPAELIMVDVRTGNATERPAKATSTALATAEAPEERRRLGGRLLQQAGHLVRGERVSLAEAAGLPETVTLRATIAGHSVTKSIQL